MSREHTTITVTVKCSNANCGIAHTAFVLWYNGANNKIECPACKWLTKQKDLNIITIHGIVKFLNK